MEGWKKVIDKFILQAKAGDLKTSEYPKEFGGLQLRISFGMGMAARVPWIAFVAPEMAVSKGFYPVYLYYKELETLVLAYGVSETEEYGTSWPAEIMSSAPTITAYFDKDVPRYGDSFVFKAYKIELNNQDVSYINPDEGIPASEKDIEADLSTILDYYKKVVSLPATAITPELSSGLFYMEKQLEDFLIQNWPNTELGKRFELIIEEGEMKSQQYRTDVGPIDILAKDKENGDYVIIELKKNHTSDDTVGQLTRYMGWVKNKYNDKGVKGIIIAGQVDKKLKFALEMVPNAELYIYEIDFNLKKTGLNE